MSDAEQQTANGEQPAEGQVPVTIHAQYVRDLSFENPDAPDSLRGSSQAPQMDINIGMDARKLETETQNSEDTYYEVVLNTRAVAQNEGKPLFVVEMQYGVTVSLGKDFPEDSHHPFLLIEMPRMVFPYVRQIISTLTMQGGFPPLMLSPVDFQSLYMKQFGDQVQKSEDSAET